jgi:hypothetical protein
LRWLLGKNLLEAAAVGKNFEDLNNLKTIWCTFSWFAKLGSGKNFLRFEDLKSIEALWCNFLGWQIGFC